jgi:amino acid transporter
LRKSATLATDGLGAPLPDEQLERVIGPWGLGANAINTAVGGGIFAMPGLVAAILGPTAIVAYLLCGIAIGLVLTCFTEIGSFVRRSGGPVAYVEEAFGPLAGFIAWILYSIGFEIGASAAIANVLVDAIASVVPPLSHGAPRVMALLTLFGVLAAINILGVREGMRLAITTTIAKLLPLLLLIIVGLLVMHWDRFRWSGWPSMQKLGEGSLLIFFAFQGAEEALSPSAEIRDPAHTVPRAMLGAIVSLVILYVALQVVGQGVLGSDLGRFPEAPLAEVAARIAGAPGRALLLAGAAISIFGSLAAGVIACPRSFFLMSQNGLLPRVLAKVHPGFHTPHWSIAAVVALMFLLSVTGAFKFLAVLSSASILCVYLAICVGALRLRYTRPRMPGAFRARGGPIVALLGSAVVVWLLTYTTRVEFGAVIGTIGVATAYFLVRRRLSPRAA